MSKARQLTVGFISLGCAKNLVDSEVIASSMQDWDFALAHSPETADIVVVNTCAFIQDAREESISAILRACELKKQGRCRAVLVAGCMPQRYRRELPEALYEADAFIGLDEIERAGSIAARLVRGEQRIVEISPRARAVIEPPPDRMLFTGAPYAYIKVSEGCDHRCAFCAIPKIRGHYRSRSIMNIVREAETLLGRGVHELNLVSQDVTSYGFDLGGGTDLAALLKALDRIGGKFWIRLLYGHPCKVDARLIETIAAASRVCRYLDLPIQHADAWMLRAMRRRETPDGLRLTFGLIRKILPDAVLRTTCLVGFPGETEKRFENLLAFLREIRFDHIGAFEYSREEGTAAAKLRAPSKAVAAARKALLLHEQRRIVAQKGRALIGRLDEILVERARGAKPDAWTGRSRALAPEVDGTVFLDGSRGGIRPGAFVNARYVARRGYDMCAVEE